MTQDPQDRAGSESVNTQFEYAWRWFELHARQRVSMFNFFFLSVGALASAYGILLREQLYGESAAVAFAAFFASVVACLLDVRNHSLVKMGEEALKVVEREHLTGCAILTEERQPPTMLKHGWLIRSLEIVVAILYLTAGVYSVALAAGYAT